MDQVVSFAIGLLAVESEGLEVVRNSADHVVDCVISRRLFPTSSRNAADLSVGGAWAERRTFQR